MTAAEATRPREEPRLLTVADYAELGETPSGYAELTEGRAEYVPGPLIDHNVACAEIRDQMKAQLPPELICVLDVDVDLQLVPDNQPGFCRRPDLVVIEREALTRQRREGGLVRARDVRIIMEAISPGSRRTDTVVKRAEYAGAGIPQSDQEEALSMADRVGVMRDGRLEQIAAPAELYSQPATAFVAEFVGTMNRIPGEVAPGGVHVLGTLLADVDTGVRANGTAVDVLARPEDLTLTAAPHGHGIVTVMTFLGSLTRVTVRLDGDVSVQVDRPSVEAAALAVGAAVEIAVTGRVLVVDPSRP